MFSVNIAFAVALAVKSVAAANTAVSAFSCSFCANFVDDGIGNDTMV